MNNATQTWSFTPSLPATTGTIYALTARVADAAGNLGAPSAIRRFTLDTTPPSKTAAIQLISDNAGLIRGTVGPGRRTDDRTPTITGTLSEALVNGETLRLYDGTTLLGTAQVNNTTRTWSFTPRLPATAGTTYALTARVADAVGNLGSSSAVRRFTLDTTPPSKTAAIQLISDNAGPIQGTVGPGRRTDDRTPTITGTLSEALARGETLRLYNGATLLGTAPVNNTNRTWSFTPSLPATAGTIYALTARVTDAAGNLGSSSAVHRFTLDTTAATLTATRPADGAEGVDPGANFILRFSETIQRGSGTIQLRVGSATGPISESFDAATSSRITIRGPLLTINPTRDLAPNTRYVLTLPAGSLTDAAGNPFAGTSTYDVRTLNTVTGTAANDVLPFTSGVDQLTGRNGADTFLITSLAQSLLPATPDVPIDRITDLMTGLDTIDAPVARRPSEAVNPAVLAEVSELSAAAIAELLTPASFPALTATSSGGAATFTFTDRGGSLRTFLAINDGEAGFSFTRDALLDITGFRGQLDQLAIF
ncbi:large repetitive protein [Cyanobium sp. Copco_Reservoir_LC18]|nr:large repetitive protein [Cyanobium sp. Copco_Reservoir_LC18]